MKTLLMMIAFICIFCRIIFCAILATDNFNRINDNDLGANWIEDVSGNLGFQISSNTALPDGSLGDDCLAVYDGGITWPADQYSQVKVTVTSTTGGGVGQGIALRGDVATNTYYRAVVDHAASNNVEVGRKVSSSFQSLAFRTTTWVDGDILRLEITGTGAARVLKVFQNGSQLGADIADASGGIDSGKPGLTYSSTATAVSADDWEGGSLESTASTLIPVLSKHRR